MHSPHQRGHRIAALTLPMAYAAILLTGCTSGPSPSPSTTPTGSTSSVTSTPTKSSASPRPTISLDIPAAAKEKSIKGGIEFAKWFANKASESYVTLDTSWLDAATLPSCGACAGLVQDVQELKDAGQRLSRSRWEFIASQAPGASLPTFDVDLVGTDRAATVIDQSGNVIHAMKDRESWLRVKVTWVAAGWRVHSTVEVDRNA